METSGANPKEAKGGDAGLAELIGTIVCNILSEVPVLIRKGLRGTGRRSERVPAGREGRWPGGLVPANSDY